MSDNEERGKDDLVGSGGGMGEIVGEEHSNYQVPVVFEDSMSFLDIEDVLFQVGRSLFNIQGF